jgi:uncharacterized protein YeaO (DUF488 family)
MGTKLYLSLAHDPKAIEEFVRHFTDALTATQKSRVGDLSLSAEVETANPR